MLVERGLGRVALVLVATSLLLSILILGNVERASAQTTCAVGTLVADQCVETGDAPAPVGPDLCPTSDTVFEDNAVFEDDPECYELVPQVGGTTCPTGSTVAPDGLSCRQPVDAIVEAATCPDGFTRDVPNFEQCARLDPATRSDPTCLPPARGTADNCYVVQPAPFTCDVGVAVGDVCQITGNASFLNLCEQGFVFTISTCVRWVDPATNGNALPCAGTLDQFGFCRVSVPARQSELQCEGAGEVLEGADCVLRIDVTSGCPVAFIADANGDCAQSIDAAQLLDDCPQGARGFVNACYILVAKGPRGDLTCSTGNLVGLTCVIIGPAAVLDANGVPACQPGFGPVSTALEVECRRFETPAQQPAQCPFGSIEMADLTCRRPVANASGAYYCPSPHAQLLGKICTTTTPALAPGACPGEIVAGDVVCTRTIPATFSDLGCRVNALGTAGNCFIYVDRDDSATRCVEGLLTPDGTACYLFPQVTPQDDTTSCPPGYTADASLGGICARFEPASEGGAACPAGARGEPGGCYILVAPGPAGVMSCAVGTLAGGQCVIEGDPPTRSEATCPVSANVMLDGDFCYRLVQNPLATFVCTADGTGAHNTSSFLLIDGACRLPVSVDQAATFDPYICPGVAGDADSVQGDYVLDDDPNDDIAGYCTLIGAGLDVCISPPDIADNGSCRRAYPLTDGDLRCAPEFGLIDDRCVRYEPATPSPTQCPENATEDVNGDCRKPVANETARYFCADANAALNGTSCVFTSGFITMQNGPLYICDRGELIEIRDQFVICILGDAIEQTSPCPAGSELQADGRCLRRVGDAVGAYHCEHLSGLGYGTECLLFPDSQRCPIDYSPDDSLGGLCARFEPASQAEGINFCADVDAELNDQACVFTTDYLYGDLGQVSVCPDAADVFADGDACFQQRSFSSAACPVDTTADQATSLCRNPVEPVAQSLACATGYELVDDECLRYSEATAVADFQVVESSQDTTSDDLVSLRSTSVDYVDCAGGSGSFTVTATDGTVVADAALTEGPAGQYSASYTVPSSGTYVVDVNLACPDGGTNTATESLVFIDPSGVITDCAGDPVAGASVTLLRSDTAAGSFVAVANGDATIMDATVNTSNPTVTSAQGLYRWDVVEGFYQVSAVVDSQDAVVSAVLAVPPARTDVDLVFATLNCVATPTATPTPTAVVQTSAPVRSTQLVGPSLPLVAPQQSASIVTSTGTANTTSTLPLAVTGSNTLPWTTLAMSLLGVGGAAVVASRRRDHSGDSINN